MFHEYDVGGEISQRIYKTIEHALNLNPDVFQSRIFHKIETGHSILTATGTEEQVVTGITLDAGSALLIRALNANTDVIYIGDDTVDDTNGYPLNPAEALSIPIKESDEVYMYGVQDDGVAYRIMKVES